MTTTKESPEIPGWLNKLMDYSEEGPPLEKVTYAYGAFRLPAEKVSYKKIEKQSFILVGEKESGIDSVIKWLRASRSKPWTRLNLQSKSSYLDLKNVEDAWGSIFDMEHSQHFLIDRTYYDSHIDNNHEDPDKLSRLAGILEDPHWLEKHQLICTTHEVLTLAEEVLFSSIFRRTHCYRPRPLYEDNLKVWLTHMADATRVKIDGAYFCEKILALAGGQPGLTFLLFLGVTRALKEFEDKKLVSQEKLKDLFHNEADLLRQNPPGFVIHWKTQLRSMLQDPEMLESLGSYVEEETRPVSGGLPLKDTQLFLAGWLGLTTPSSWGIRSSLHRDWASEVLGEMP